MLQSRVISEASFTFVSIREFTVVNRACFQIQGFIFLLRLYFKRAIPISGFATMTSRANNIRSRCATTCTDYQLRHLAVIPLRLSA